MIRTIVALALAAAVAGSCGPAPLTATAGPGATLVPAAQRVATLGEQRSDGGGVEVVATWSSAASPTLTVTMDTHSVELDGFDLAALARLRLDAGEWVAPSAFDAPEGGHHRAGTLAFGTIPPAAFASARLIELRIVDVAVPERLLRWERAR